MEQQSNVSKFDYWMKEKINSAHYGTHSMFNARRIVATHQINSQKNKLKKI